MKSIFLFLMALVGASAAYGQVQWLPDTLIAINGKGFLSCENSQHFVFSDGGQAMLLYANDSISSVVGGGNMTIPGDFNRRVIYQVDANEQFVRAAYSPCYNYLQVADSIYGIATVLWNDTLNLNPFGTAVLVTDTPNTMSNSYFVVYDRNLQLVRHKHVNQNKFSGGSVKLVSGGKIYINFFEKDDHPINGSYAMGRQRLVVYDMSLNVLSNKTYFDRIGTIVYYDVLDRLVRMPSGNFYGLFKDGSGGEPIDIALQPSQTLVRPVGNDAPAWLVKYDANLNVLWDAELKSTNPQYSWQVQVIAESPSQDSLLLIGMTGLPGLIYNHMGLTDTMQGDTGPTFQQRFHVMIGKTTGQLGRHHLAHAAGVYESGTGMWRYLRNYPYSFGPGPTKYEELNFLTGSFPVPDSQSVIAWYDDPTTGIPAYYRMLGQMGLMSASYVTHMAESPYNQALYMVGSYTDDLRLDSAMSYIMPAYSSITNVFIGIFQPSVVLSAPPAQPSMDFALYPNPASEAVHVRLLTGQAHAVQVLDLNGVVLRSALLAGRNEWACDLQGLAAGVYFVEVVDQQGQRFGRRLVHTGL